MLEEFIGKRIWHDGQGRQPRVEETIDAVFTSDPSLPGDFEFVHGPRIGWVRLDCVNLIET
jgi:hypothetical protein